MTKNSSFFIRKTPLLFPRKSKVWKFWEIWAKIPFETHSIKILPISAIIKILKQFFEITHLLSRKSQAVEGFPFSRAIRVFERHSKEKYPCLAFLKTFKCFLKKTSLFPKTQRSERLQNTWAQVNCETQLKKKLAKLGVCESFQNVFFQDIYSRCILRRTCQNWRVLIKSSFFSEWKDFFSKETKIWTFWELLSIITIWDAFQSFFWTFAFLKKFQSFFRKKAKF